MKVIGGPANAAGTFFEAGTTKSQAC
jgi:hypothetical protein